MNHGLLRTTGVAYIPDTIIGPNPNPKGGGLCRKIVFVTCVSMSSRSQFFLSLQNLEGSRLIRFQNQKQLPGSQSRSIIKVAYEAHTCNIRRKSNWGRQTTLRGEIHTSFQVGSFLADWKPVIPINDFMRFHNPVCLLDTTCPSCRKYNLVDRRQLNETERIKKAVAYDSFINKTISTNTTRLYNVPIPYAHLHVVRATKNPKTNGDRWGETTTPIVHILI